MIGDKITVNGVELLVLDEINGNPFVIALNTGIECRFDDKNNNYAKSELRNKTEKWLKDKGIKTINRSVDLMTMDGYTGYGTLDVLVAPLTFDEYRKYASVMRSHIGHSFWLVTGWGTPEIDNWASYRVCLVGTSGAANSFSYNYSYGLAPAFILDKNTAPKCLDDYSIEELVQALHKKSHGV